MVKKTQKMSKNHEKASKKWKKGPCGQQTAPAGNKNVKKSHTSQQKVKKIMKKHLNGLKLQQKKVLLLPRIILDLYIFMEKAFPKITKKLLNGLIKQPNKMNQLHFIIWVGCTKQELE